MDRALFAFARWSRTPILATVAALALASAPMALAQQGAADTAALQRLRPRIGLFGFGALNVHSGDFTGVPEAPTCLEFDQGSFTGGTGLGGGAGLLFELPIDPVWSVMLRGGIAALGADDELEANIGPSLDPATDQPVDVFSLYTFSSSLTAFTLDATLGLRPFEFPLTFRLGPEFGFLLSAESAQSEQIARPAGAAYTTGPNGERTRVRNAQSGALENTTMRLAALAGVEVELPMNERGTLLLVPDLAWSWGLTDVRSDLDWSASQLRLGASIRYSFPVPVAAPPEPEPPPVREPALAATMDLVSVGSDGTVFQNVPIRVEEFINTQTRAFLNYIFFEENSAAIPTRYTLYANGPTSFSRRDLHNLSTLEVYYHSLNVLGSRMVENPSATISLTGTNSDRGPEAGNTALSQARADSVKAYLVRVWGIAPERISTSARNLPALPSAPDDPDGIAENRRVEIAASTLALLEPITTEDTLRTVDPPIVRLTNTHVADAGVGRWRFDIVQGDRLMHSQEGVGPVPSTVEWNMLVSPDRVPLTEEPLVGRLALTDGRGVSVTAEDQATVEQITIRRKREERRGDIVYERFNLITFEFDKSTLSPLNRRIAELIKSRIQPRSEVEIVGYTDRLGLEGYNLELSRSRATTTAQALGVPATSARGAGENTELYDNNLPEGRFLSRTVDVTVKTKVGG